MNYFSKEGVNIMSKRKENRKNLKSSLLVLLLIAILLIASTYAWFTANRTVSIDTLEVNVQASNGLQISTNAVDWKAVSHAFRCCYQIEELLNIGFLQYPLKDAEFLKQIKYGKLDWKTLDPMLFNEISKIENKLLNVESNYDEMIELHKSFILSFYK